MECKKIHGMNNIKNKTSPYMAMLKVIKSSASEDTSLLDCYACPKRWYLPVTYRAGKLGYSCPKMLLLHNGTVKSNTFWSRRMVLSGVTLAFVV
jgi:hypothetical protein